MTIQAAGYQDALTKYGLPIAPELIIAYDLNLDSSIYVNHLLNLPNPPGTLFTINDPTALEVFSVAKRRGIRVPDELAIAGFSDHPVSALIEPSRSPFMSLVSRPLRSCSDN